MKRRIYNPPYNRLRAKQSVRNLNSCPISRVRSDRRRQQGPSPPPSGRPPEEFCLLWRTRRPRRKKSRRPGAPRRRWRGRSCRSRWEARPPWRITRRRLLRVHQLSRRRARFALSSHANAGQEGTLARYWKLIEREDKKRDNSMVHLTHLTNHPRDRTKRRTRLSGRLGGRVTTHVVGEIGVRS